MRIDRITLENFRCFRQAEIDLSADVVAIYGRNGVGKTAIFDAVEFALLGSIGRFVQESTGSLYYLPHVLSDDNGVIHINFKGDIHWVKLNIDRLNFNVSIETSGNCGSHSELLYDFFVNQHYFPPRRDVSRVAELFRATVLLSQDSIRDFVEGDIAKRSRILSYLSGSGYFQRCFDKAKDVMKEAKKRERQEQAKLGEAERTVVDMRARLAEQDAQIEVIRERSGEGAVSCDVVLRALEDAGISVSIVMPQTPEDAEIFSASVRGAINERITTLDERSKLLAQLEAMNQQHPDRLKRRRELHEMVEKARENLVELLKKENTTAEYLKNLDAGISELNLNISEKSKNFNSLQMLHGLQRQWAELTAAQEKTSNKIAQIQSELGLARSKLEKHETALNLAKKEVGDYVRATENTSSNLEKLRALRTSLPTYMTSQGKIRQLKSQVDMLNKKRSDLLEEIAKLQSQDFKFTERINAVNRKISGMKASLQEAADLIARLKQYAAGSKCPLCGHTHPSSKALQDAMDIQMKDVPVAFQEAGKELQDLSDKLVILNANLEGYEKELKQVDDAPRKAQSEREETVLIIHKIEANSVALGVSLTPEDLEGSINQCQASLSDLQTNCRQADERFNKAEKQLKDAKGTTQSLEDVLGKHTEVYRKHEHKLDDVELKVIDIGMPNESKLPANQVLGLVEAIRPQLADLNRQKSEQETARDKVQSEWDACRTERMKLESSLAEWERTLGRLTSDIEDFHFRCKTIGLPLDASSDVIAEARNRLSQDKDRLYSAMQIVERYEWVLKATELERESEKLHLLIRNAEQTVNQRNGEIEKLREAANETESWISGLSESVNLSVKTKIDAHEPEIMRLFKAMIPCPFLFDKVTMKRGGAGLELGLRYRGQEEDAGEPRFFLSNAQANVLALSIFLSFATGQNWSKLETILLDDPVQHLDDLDAVAFLDNLRAAALGKFGPRKQIVVSTCDKNLYLLMLRKFGLLEADGLHFTGISLLDKGFEGPEIIYDVGGPQGRRLLLRAV